MNHGMIHSGIEYSHLFFRATFYLDTGKIIVPSLTGLRTQFVECCAERLFFFQIQTSILNADKRYAHTDLNHFFRRSIVSKPHSYIISAYFFCISSIEFVFTGCIVPLRLHTHRTHHFPITAFCRYFVDTHYKIDGKYCLRIVTESSQQLGTFNLTVVYKTNGSTTLIGQSLSQIQQDIALSGRKSKACHTGTWGGSQFTFHIVFIQYIGIITRICSLTLIETSIIMIIHIQFAGGRHQ